MRRRAALGLALAALVGGLGVVLAPTGRLDLYLVLTLIGLLVARALLGPYVDEALVARLDLFVLAGFAGFVFVVVQRVREILNL